MSLQISTIFTQFEYFKKDISDVSDALKVQWAQMMSDYIYRNITKTDPERFMSEQSYTITSGTNSYALPTDFDNIRVLNSGMYRLDDNSKPEARLLLTHYGSQNDGYYINNTNIILTPDPYEDSYSAKLRYIPEAPQYTATTDYLTINKLSTGKEIIPEGYLEYVITALDSFYNAWDEDPSAESLSNFRYLRALDVILANIRKTGAAYEMPDVSSLY